MNQLNISLPSKRQRRTSTSEQIVHVLPGELVTSEHGILRGHGTITEDKKLISTVSGLVQKVNRLISVQPLRMRYSGMVGDVVVGRILEVEQGRWKVEVNSRLEAILQLSAINLPGGVQRKRTKMDELNMRNFFRENDPISAEVQSIHSDGTLVLHTRSTRYGRLMGGIFFAVRSVLVRRCKSHFHDFDFGVSLILGNNGYIWIYPSDLTSDGSNPNSERAVKGGNAEITLIPVDLRLRMIRVRNAIGILSLSDALIHPPSILHVYESSIRLDIPPGEMLNSAIFSRLLPW